MTSETYTLNQFRRAQLAAPRVRDDSVIVDTGDNAAHSGDSAKSRTWWRIGPGDDPCAKYAACEASTWLWSPTLAGEFDFTPPDHTERGVAALVGGAQVAIFRTYDGELFAIDNRDPIAGANVMSRGIVGSRGEVPIVGGLYVRRAGTGERS